MKKHSALLLEVAAVVCVVAALPATAAGDTTHLYWGDLHLHTNYSIDAYATGNLGVTPDMAYRFARGIPIDNPNVGTKIQIRRPLDFLAVTDHAEMLGLEILLNEKDPRVLATEWGRKMLAARQDPRSGGVMRAQNNARGAERKQLLEQLASPAIRQATWESEIAAAEKNYVPGTFTTLIGWEWTAMPDGGKNLHRCVISDADGNAAKGFVPFSNYESIRPEDLWRFLQQTKARTGVDFLAIPHNSNLSGGLMFDMVDSDGHPLSAEYARTRALWEPLVEITQTKGTSEVRPELAPTDEFAEFEIRRKLLAGQPTPPSEADYVRSALLRGLVVQQSVGVNPYKLGIVGGTDSHTGMSSVQESNFMGKLAMDETLAERVHPSRPTVFPAWEMSASGRTAVWATENTRKGIFAALKRKESYGTTGTRITLRVFGGYSFRSQDALAKDFATVGYRGGVPMGGELTAAPKGGAPRLLIFAAKDPLSGNLDRIQVVKGWVDAAGKPQQHVYDVVWSGDRHPGADSKVPAVGNTVDVKTGLYTNTIGASQLSTVWTDPDFNREQSAFYYVRVLEIPTPRHSLFDAIALGIDVSQTHEPATLQERAYSSPIWYTPEKS